MHMMFSSVQLWSGMFCPSWKLKSQWWKDRKRINSASIWKSKETLQVLTKCRSAGRGSDDQLQVSCTSAKKKIQMGLLVFPRQIFPTKLLVACLDSSCFQGGGEADLRRNSGQAGLWQPDTSQWYKWHRLVITSLPNTGGKRAVLSLGSSLQA